MGDVTFQPGDSIYEAGAVSSSAYIIKSGHVRISLELNGRRLDIDVGPGDFIGDSAAVLRTEGSDPPVNRGTAWALDEVVVHELPIKLLEDELANASPLLRGWFASFVDRALKVITKATE